MSDAQLQIIYDGPALREGLMDVKDLAPALLAMGQLCQAANQVLNQDRAEVSVQIKAGIHRGSFGVDLQVVQSLYSHASSILVGISDEVKTANELTDLLGLTGAGGLLGLYKWLKNRKPKSTPISVGAVKLEIDHLSLEIPSDVIRLLNDGEVRDGFRKLISPLEKPGIDSFSVKKGQRVVASVDKSEVQYFSPEQQDEEVLLDEERRAMLEVISLSFDERYKWRFSDGSATLLIWNFSIDSEPTAWLLGRAMYLK